MEFILSNFKIIFLSIGGITLLVLVIKNYTKIKKFLLEVKTELNKVSWSTRQELIGATFVIIVVTGIMALFIGIIDIFLSRILSLIFS